MHTYLPYLTTRAFRAVGYTWPEEGPLTTGKVFDVMWLGEWTPDIRAGLISAHKTILRPGPIPGDNGVVFLDMESSRLRRLAWFQLAKHLCCDSKCCRFTPCPDHDKRGTSPIPLRGHAARVLKSQEGEYGPRIIACHWDSDIPLVGPGFVTGYQLPNPPESYSLTW